MIMMSPKYFWGKLGVVVIAISLVLGWRNQSLGEKYTPDHPLVQGMVQRGVAFLSSKTSHSGEGINILSGYAIFKVNGDPDNPVVASAIKEAKEIAASVSRTSGSQESGGSLYVQAVAGMLLATVDVEGYGTQVRQIRDFLIRSQKQNGGFGYLTGGPTGLGDISQTQYVMLSLWTMSQLGIEVPEEPMVGAISFLVAAQTKEGGWPYQFAGTSSTGTNGNESAPATNSLAAAGLSAILIAGDALGLYRSKVADNQEEEGIIPTAFKRISLETERRAKANIDRTKLDNAAKRGEVWHNANPYRRAAWHYYYVYSRERYESFLEITKGKQQKSPDWYNQAVESLLDLQAPNGSWGQSANDVDTSLGPEVCTSFCVLFLIRSTQKAIGSLNEAYVVGGDFLPDDLTSISAIGGKVMSKTATTSIDDALKMLEEDAKSSEEDELVADKMLLSSDPKRRKEQLNRIARLLTAKEAKSRKIAAKLLGRGDDLDVAPALIYALTDPDSDVPRIAEQSLRLISRQMDTHHFPKNKAEKLSFIAKENAAKQWKKWYLTLKPDFIFVD